MRKQKIFVENPCFCIDHLKITILLCPPKPFQLHLYCSFLECFSLASSLQIPPTLFLNTLCFSSKHPFLRKAFPDPPHLCYRVTLYVRLPFYVFWGVVAVSYRMLSAPGGWDCVCLLTFESSVSGRGEALDKLLLHE